MSISPFFTPLRLGAINLPNRIVMAPMTRMRAGPGNTPTSLNVEYYAQRASAGLIVTEGTAISAQAQGYPNAPGIYTEEHVNGWRRITAEVHSRGGRIVLQIAHNGRNSHSSLTHGAQPVAPSAIAPNIPALTSDGRQVSAELPRELTLDEIFGIIDDFRIAAIRGMDAGFDGIELQAANSHLIDQFLEDGSNRRTDRYGESIANRAAFLAEIVESVGAAIGFDRLGVRLSPFGQYAGIHDSRPLQLFTAVIHGLSAAGLAYLHLIEARAAEIGLRDGVHQNGLDNAKLFRAHFDGPLITAGAYNATSAALVIDEGYADAVAFGRLFIANPDLVDRLRNHWPLEHADRATFYGGDARGYTDYPKMVPAI